MFDRIRNATHSDTMDRASDQDREMAAVFAVVDGPKHRTGPLRAIGDERWWQ